MRDSVAMVGPPRMETVWQIGLFDAHCHPTDIMSSIKDISSMKAKVLTVMSTRSQDQDLVAQAANDFPMPANSHTSNLQDCSIVPAFGWHPWFSYQLYDDRSLANKPNSNPLEHYRRVLTPSPDDETFLKSLPAPRSLSEFLAETEERLLQHPYALVGEVGLDKAFRLPVVGFKSPPPGPADKLLDIEQAYTPGSREGRALSPYRVSMDHQKAILKAQLQLAGKHGRPVSVHSVQAHGAVIEILQELWKGHENPSKRQQKRGNSVSDALVLESNIDEVAPGNVRPLPYPPRICMHSYSGPADPLRQFLHPSVPADVFFSFSQVINFSTALSGKVTEVIKAVPASQILIESDYHCAGERMDAMLQEIVEKVCEIKNWTIQEGAERLRENWRRFVFGK